VKQFVSQSLLLTGIHMIFQRLFVKNSFPHFIENLITSLKIPTQTMQQPWTFHLQGQYEIQTPVCVVTIRMRQHRHRQSFVVRQSSLIHLYISCTNFWVQYNLNWSYNFAILPIKNLTQAIPSWFWTSYHVTIPSSSRRNVKMSTWTKRITNRISKVEN
jgi:hypothetical protein